MIGRDLSKYHDIHDIVKQKVTVDERQDNCLSQSRFQSEVWVTVEINFDYKHSTPSCVNHSNDNVNDKSQMSRFQQLGLPS